MIQLFGSGFGQAGSTVNGDGAPPPAAPVAAVAGALAACVDAQAQASSESAAARDMTLGEVFIASSWRAAAGRAGILLDLSPTGARPRARRAGACSASRRRRGAYVPGVLPGLRHAGDTPPGPRGRPL